MENNRQKKEPKIHVNCVCGNTTTWKSGVCDACYEKKLIENGSYEKKLIENSSNEKKLIENGSLVYMNHETIRAMPLTIRIQKIAEHHDWLKKQRRLDKIFIKRVYCRIERFRNRDKMTVYHAREKEKKRIEKEKYRLEHKAEIEASKKARTEIQKIKKRKWCRLYYKRNRVEIEARRRKRLMKSND